jgi:phospholipase/carboxylesterase
MLDYAELPSRPEPRALMIWMHGLGTDGHDLEPVAEMLDMAGIHHVFPHAPVRPVTINGGMAMRAWYDIAAAADLHRFEDSEGMHLSAQKVRELADSLCADSALPIVLAGFSQGAVISLTVAAQGMPNLAGVVALSGYVPQFLLSSLAGLRTTPVLMAHGEQDEVIPYAMAKAGKEILEGGGVKLDWHSYAMPHTICQQEIWDMRDWLTCLLEKA